MIPNRNECDTENCSKSQKEKKRGNNASISMAMSDVRGLLTSINNNRKNTSSFSTTTTTTKLPKLQTFHFFLLSNIKNICQFPI